MEFAKFPEDQWKAFGGVRATMDDIREKSDTIVRSLEARCEGVHSLAASGFAITPTESGGSIVAEIKTPFGNGRAKLAWGVDGGQLVGVLEFEKASQDAYGKDFHARVWALKIPRQEPAYSAKGERGVQMSSSPYDDDLKKSYFEVLVSIIAAFAGTDLQISLNP